MPYRVKPTKRRSLWIEIKIHTGGEGKSRVDAIRTLIDAVKRGDYRYPDGWYVQIEWRNRENAPNRIGEFAAEMHLSKRSSNGFDKAVLEYLRSKL